MLSKHEFVILAMLMKERICSQREISLRGKISLGTVNRVYRNLVQKGFVEDYRVTPQGLEALSSYKVENAIIMAAGFASRFAPISYSRPKGLLKVKGEVLIERQIRQLQEAGINDITVVVGYKKEQFYYLAEKCGVEIVVNPEYAERNNHSTLWVVREKLGNTYVCSSDNYFTKNVFSQYEYEAYVPGVVLPGVVTEWVVELGAGNRIVKYGEQTCEGKMVASGQAFFDREFSAGMVGILEEEYDLPQMKPKLWDHVFSDHVKELRMVAVPYPNDVILEFDSLDDLRAFDPEFIVNVDSEILDNICCVLQCGREDISGIKPLKEGLTNLSFRFDALGGTYVYRHPGPGSEELVDRGSEAAAEAVAQEIGLDRTFIYEDAEEGWKISRFVECSDRFCYEDSRHLEAALRMLSRLHKSDGEVSRKFDAYDEGMHLVKLMYGGAKHLPEGIDSLVADAGKIKEYFDTDAEPVCLVHGDAWGNNILVSKDGFDLIDWEYAAMGDYTLDVGSFLQPHMSDERLDAAFDIYFGGEASEEQYLHCLTGMALARFYWAVWAMYQAHIGQSIGEDELIWYEFAKKIMRKALDLRAA